MSGRVAWMLAGGAGVLLWSAAASAQCTKDTDCKGERICEEGKCTSPQRTTGPAPNAEASAVAPESASSAAPADGSPPAATPPGSDPAALGGSPLANDPAALGVAPPPAGSSPAAAEPLANPSVEPLREDVAMRRRSRPAMVSGIIMTAVGPVALIAALIARNSQEDCDQRLSSDYPDHVLPPSERYRVKECDRYSVPLYVLGIGGAVLTSAGIPLIVYGAKRVPTERSEARLQILPWAGRESGGVRLRLEL